MALNSAELQETGLLAIIRTPFPVDLVRVAQSLADGGVRAMEITLSTPGALDALGTIRKDLGPTLRVGAGTVLGAEDAQRARDAGAEFCVTPTLQLETITFCCQNHIPLFCGCMTPTEALAAHQAGADFIKLFPADTLGPAYVRAVLAPLPFLKIVPTGGITRDNIGAYLSAGAVGVAVGSSLVNAQVLREEDWPRLTRLAREFQETFASARAEQKEPFS